MSSKIKKLVTFYLLPQFSRHVRMHRVIFYTSNTLRKLMISFGV